jgi:TPR repeat protein
MSTILDEIKVDKSLNVKDLDTDARKNIIHAKLELAKRLILGEGVKQNPESAKSLLEDIAVSDDGEANYILGRLYIENLISDPLRKKGIEKIENSSAKNYEKATLFLAFSSLNGINDVEKDIDIADKNLRRLGLSGNHEAQFELGKIYEQGVKGEIEKDVLEAVRWFEMSTKGGVYSAYNRLGYIYYYGYDEVPQDYKTAINNWEAELEIYKSDETYFMLSNAYAKHALTVIEKVENKSDMALRHARLLNEIN